MSFCFGCIPALLLTACFNSCFAAEMDFRLSKVHALFVFAQTATGAPHRSRTLLEYFENSPLNSSEVKLILNDFKETSSSLSAGFNFNGLPKDRKSGSNGESLRYAPDHPDPAVFWSELSPGRSLGVMVADDVAQVAVVLDQLKKMHRIDMSKTKQTI